MGEQILKKSLEIKKSNAVRSIFPYRSLIVGNNLINQKNTQ